MVLERFTVKMSVGKERFLGWGGGWKDEKEVGSDVILF